MASKIQSHNFYVAITPYKVEDSSADEFNELNVRTAYDDCRKYFYVTLHAGWDTGWGGHGCILMGADDPLTGPKYVKVKDSPKNSQKTINEMGENLEQAKDAIAWLFDHREWAKLYLAVGNIARYGYTEQFRKQMEELINSTNNNINNQNSEVMENKTNNNQESVNVQNNAQVNNEVESVAVGEMTVDSIMPRMSAEPEEPVKVEGSEYQVSDGKGGSVTFESVIPAAVAKAATDGTATTMPLGQHGTLVIASGGEKSKPRGVMPKVTLRKKTKQTEPDTEAVGELSGMLTRVRLFEYTTSRNEKALGIAGFSGEDDPRWKPIRDERRRLASEYKEAKAKDPKAKAKSHPIYLSRMMDPATGGWCNTMLLGPRYMDVTKQLCEAYNTDDREAWATAVQAVIDTKNGIVAGYQAEKAARRAAREAEREAQSTQPAAPQGKTYTAADMEALVRAMAQAMATAQGADVKKFEPLVQAAMKKAA